MSDDNSSLVYSTDYGVARRKSGAKTGKREISEVKDSGASSPARLIVRLERKGRGGKSVTVIDGLQMSREKKEGLLRQLKSNLGTGGTLTDTTLEIQGEHCRSIIDALKRMGYTAKHSGG